MMTGLSGSPRVAWLFTRDQKSVWLEVRIQEDQVRLLVAGPGSKRATLDFPDLITLLDYQATCEQQLTADGFVLDHFVSERRRWPR
jgi:hypothetical protein